MQKFISELILFYRYVIVMKKKSRATNSALYPEIEEDDITDREPLILPIISNSGLKTSLKTILILGV